MHSAPNANARNRRMPAWLGHPLVLVLSLAGLVWTWSALPTQGGWRVSIVGRWLSEVGLARPGPSVMTQWTWVSAIYLREPDGTLTTLSDDQDGWLVLGALPAERSCDVCIVSATPRSVDVGLLFPTRTESSLEFRAAIGIFDSACTQDQAFLDHAKSAFLSELASPKFNKPLLAAQLQSPRPLSTRPLASGYVLNTIPLASLAGLLLFPFALPSWIRANRARRRLRASLCPRCAYPRPARTTAHAAGTCPECGYAFTSPDTAEPPAV